MNIDNLTQEQMEYVHEHLREPQKTFSICAIAKKISQNCHDVHLDEEEVEQAALLMNIGETSDKMNVNGVSIYSKEYGPWDDVAKQLNADRGKLSVEMAEEQGIELSQGVKDAIISTSKGGSLNKIAITLKLAQTMEAIKHPRWSRGEKKEPAKDIAEVTEILSEELSFMLRGQDIDDETKSKIQESMISAAREAYASQIRNSIRTKVIGVNFDEVKTLQEMGIEYISPSTMEPPRLDVLLDGVPAEEIDKLHYEIIEATSQTDKSTYELENLVDAILKDWEKKCNVRITDDASIE